MGLDLQTATQYLNSINFEKEQIDLLVQNINSEINILNEQINVIQNNLNTLYINKQNLLKQKNTIENVIDYVNSKIE